MTNIFWKKKEGAIENAVEKPFNTESALEHYVFKNNDLLKDIFIFGNQVGTKNGTIDLLGADNEQNIVLIEIKNETADEKVFPQILKYAMWLETNPDSVKNLWNDCSGKPDDLRINWDSALSIRVLIIAPEFKKNVPLMGERINYQVDLLKINRFASENEEFLLVEPIEKTDQGKTRITKSRGEYDEDTYLDEHDKKSVKHFLKTVTIIDEFQKTKGWKLQKKLNKYYISFKQGFFNSFGVTWLGSRSFGVFFKLRKSTIKKLVEKDPLKNKDKSQWNELVYKIDEDEDFNPEKFKKLFEEAYKKIGGN